MIRLYLDFDGTITYNDVGDELFIEYADFYKHSAELMAGTIDVRTYYNRVVASMQPICTPDILKRFAENQNVDSGFRSLIEFCRRHDIKVTIVSDGFDKYISPILDKHLESDNSANAEMVEVVCNTLEYNGAKWTPGYPGAVESCTCFCASCKRNIVINSSSDSDIIVYVGDGMSDECAIQHCDVIFAKKSLASFCNSHHIPHHQFKTLSDVQKILATKLATGGLKQRRQAMLARNSALRSE